MNWELICYFVAYSLVLFLFVRFGKFMKECDEQMNEQLRKELEDK